MVVALIIVSVLLLLQSGYLLLYRSQIRDIGKQLDFIGKHGSFKWISTQIKPPEVERLMGSCNVLLQRQRELEQQFARRNEEINTTIISLSHDIRTPLTALDGYLQLADGDSGSEQNRAYNHHRKPHVGGVVQGGHAIWYSAPRRAY